MVVCLNFERFELSFFILEAGPFSEKFLVICGVVTGDARKSRDQEGPVGERDEEFTFGPIQKGGTIAWDHQEDAKYSCPLGEVHDVLSLKLVLRIEILQLPHFLGII